MSWLPQDLASACTYGAYITTCTPSTFIFLQMITSLFGGSRDAPRFPQSFPQSFPHDFHQGSQYYGPEIERTEYDFIVVGAGSAGCVVANRLSEKKKWNVLLLEAGTEEPDVADVPAFAPILLRSSIDWGYMTQPSPRSCRARTNGRCLWSRGKVMGGSSTINYLIYLRGHPLDYDEWAASGNPGWSYRDVLPYFIKSENNRNLDRVEAFYHGVGGYQTVEIFPYQDQNEFLLIQGYKELGLPEFDQNTERLIGTSLLQHTTEDGERLSTNGAFLRPVRNKRENLEVRANVHVNRVLIDPTTKVAFGVEYYYNGKIQRVYAKKEVILSAGSINSPKILMLSGVGPADELAKHGIPLIKELPVGYNLHDHTTIDGVMFAMSNNTATTVSDEERDDDVRYYKRTHRGPLSATGTLQVNAFVQTKYASGDRPDIQYSLEGINVQNFLIDPILTAETNVLPVSYFDGIMVRPILLNPRSRGVVQLNNSDPVYGDPLIYANTFMENIDLLTIVEGVKQSLNLVNTRVLRDAGYQLVDVPWPDCQEYRFGSDDYWSCIAMSYTTTIFHPVGTCKMGPRNDKDAVVDSKLRVYGVKNLRVIDSSIMPIIMRGNTNAPTIMIGEKGSDYIKDFWGKAEVGRPSRPYDVTESL